MSEQTPSRPVFDRRTVLAGGALAAVAALWPATTAEATVKSGRGVPWHQRRGRTEFDVACLGNTFAANFGEAIDAEAGNMRGVGFNVEGLIFKAGTIPDGDGFDPDSAEAQGLWLCRGWFIFGPDRDLPHVITTQEYLLGVVGADNPSPADQLVSSGVEGGVESSLRSVIGGTGRYRKARGDVEQIVTGTNTTVLRDIGDPAPNFRFKFRL